MANIIIAGDAVVVKSTLTLDDIRTVATYRPKALVLKGGEDGKEPVFAIGVTNGEGSINSVGASFGRESHDDKKNAIITLSAQDATGDITDWVADRLGAALVNLSKLEATIPDVLNEIAAEKAAIKSSITVAN